MAGISPALPVFYC